MRRGAKRVTRATMVLALLLTVGGYIAPRTRCRCWNSVVRRRRGRAGQPVRSRSARLASGHIAGVADSGGSLRRGHRRLAAAMQESHLHNLHYGDLDSVGVFQQRPSEGWGTRLPALRPRLRDRQVLRRAGQGARLPADSRLPRRLRTCSTARTAPPSRNSSVAASLSGAFTGGRPHAVWCWFPAARATARRRAGARTPGRLTCGCGPAEHHAVAARADPAAEVRVRHRAAGWAVAAGWSRTPPPTGSVTAVTPATNGSRRRAAGQGRRAGAIIRTPPVAFELRW